MQQNVNERGYVIALKSVVTSSYFHWVDMGLYILPVSLVVMLHVPVSGNTSDLPTLETHPLS